MRRRLYKDDSTMTEEAISLDLHISKLIRPAVQKHMRDGVCIRDVKSVVVDAVNVTVIEEIMSERIRQSKEKRKKELAQLELF